MYLVCLHQTPHLSEHDGGTSLTRVGKPDTFVTLFNLNNLTPIIHHYMLNETKRMAM